MTTVLCIMGISCVASFIIFMYESKHAPIVDDTEPFLWEDFEPK